MKSFVSDVEAAVADFYELLDDATSRALGSQPVSCTKGCAHCCYLPVSCGLPGAIYIAAEVVRWPDWREVARALVAHARRQMGMSLVSIHDDWFRRRVPCPFLTVERTCRIYERRPPSCRSHFVRSAPESCSADSLSPRVERYDSSEATRRAVEFDRLFFEEMESLGPFHQGFLSHMVLSALWLCLEGGDRKWLAKQVDGLASPREWWAKTATQALRASAVVTVNEQ